jgi:hypothetical protein
MTEPGTGRYSSTSSYNRWMPADRSVIMGAGICRRVA